VTRTLLSASLDKERTARGTERKELNSRAAFSSHYPEDTNKKPEVIRIEMHPILRVLWSSPEDSAEKGEGRPPPEVAEPDLTHGHYGIIPQSCEKKIREGKGDRGSTPIRRRGKDRSVCRKNRFKGPYLAFRQTGLRKHKKRKGEAKGGTAHRPTIGLKATGRGPRRGGETGKLHMRREAPYGADRFVIKKKLASSPP